MRKSMTSIWKSNKTFYLWILFVFTISMFTKLTNLFGLTTATTMDMEEFILSDLESSEKLDKDNNNKSDETFVPKSNESNKRKFNSNKNKSNKSKKTKKSKKSKSTKASKSLFTFDDSAGKSSIINLNSASVLDGESSLVNGGTIGMFLHLFLQICLFYFIFLFVFYLQIQVQY